MRPLAAALALLLTACGSTPGLTLRCDGRCHLVPANLAARHGPGDGHPYPAR
jgi:hypothetical protein